MLKRDQEPFKTELRKLIRESSTSFVDCTFYPQCTVLEHKHQVDLPPKIAYTIRQLICANKKDRALELVDTLPSRSQSSIMAMQAMLLMFSTLSLLGLIFWMLR